MNWDNNSIVIYSNFPFHVEDWSPLSVNKGIGGSEEAIIYLGQELVKLGYQVTVELHIFYGWQGINALITPFPLEDHGMRLYIC